jgi:hypothetical protein
MTNLWPLVRHFQIVRLQFGIISQANSHCWRWCFGKIPNYNKYQSAYLNPASSLDRFEGDGDAVSCWHPHRWWVVVGHCCWTLFLLSLPPLLAVLPMFAEMVLTSVFPALSSLHLSFAYSLRLRSLSSPGFSFFMLIPTTRGRNDYSAKCCL